MRRARAKKLQVHSIYRVRARREGEWDFLYVLYAVQKVGMKRNVLETDIFNQSMLTASCCNSVLMLIPVAENENHTSVRCGSVPLSAIQCIIHSDFSPIG